MAMIRIASFVSDISQHTQKVKLHSFLLIRAFFWFHGPMFGKIKTKLRVIPAKETPNMSSKQFDCPITLLHFKLRQSETFHTEVPRRDDVVCIRVRYANEKSGSFLFDEPIKC